MTSSSRKVFSPLRSISLALIVFTTIALASMPAFAYANSVTYTGQGLTADGFGGYDLNLEICGVANGADVDGPYLLWVLTANGANHADIAFFGGTPVPMTKFGNGTFKYISGWLDPSTLPGNVTATYDGKAKNAQFTISHGCRPAGNGWCSPGFWRNALPGAWALVAPLTPSSLFNTTVYDFWYGATFAADPTLLTVLNNPPTYSGPPLPGTSGYALNAFNATGAMLTDAIPHVNEFTGFSFDALLNDHSDTCPIDHFGNFK